MELQIVERVLEGEQGDWAYRFRETKHGVLVRRVAKDHRLWSHGVLVQMFDKDADAFLPSNVCGSNVYLGSLADARQVAELRGD
jgi:hypothetical protein